MGLLCLNIRCAFFDCIHSKSYIWCLKKFLCASLRCGDRCRDSLDGRGASTDRKEGGVGGGGDNQENREKDTAVSH